MNEDKQLVLIVEDEKKIADLLSDYFAASGFTPLVLGRGDLVLSLVRDEPPDLIILDLMLPGMDGITLCRQIRARWEIPIIMLTAKIEEQDILLGLEQGADDYIKKPFSPREVVARAKTVLRRTGQSKIPKTICAGGIRLNQLSREMYINGQSVHLTQNEYGILALLMTSPGKVFSREEMIRSVQGYESGEYKRTIDTHIKNLRKKMAAAMPGTTLISSIYGMGYKFSPEKHLPDRQS